MVFPLAALLAVLYWWEAMLAVLLGMVKYVFGMLVYSLLGFLGAIFLAFLLLLAVRHGVYWLWCRLTGKEA